MPFPNNSYVSAASSTGVATAVVEALDASLLQISITGITGSSTVTLTVIPRNGSSYESVVDGTISLSAPTTVLIDGRIHSVKATAGTTSDTFTLVATKAD